ncbi:MAG: diguanylate cyclase [Candidatus Melainabacteria bacterium]|nr:diguanylate cyclase [Candidatus Melainabacteria bacterium]
MLSKLTSNLNIRTRLLLLCLGVALPLLAIGSFSIWKQYGSLKDEAHRATTFQAAIAARTLTHWTEAQIKTLTALSNLGQLRKFDAGTSKPIFVTALQAQPDWEELILVKPDGKTQFAVSQDETVESTAAPHQHVDTGTACNDQTSLNQVLKSKKPLLSNFCHSPWTGKPALLVMAPIVEAGKVKSILVATIKPESVFRVFHGLTKNGAVITVVDKNRRVVTRTLQNNYWQGKDFSNSVTVRAANKSKSGSLEAVGIADPIARAYAFDHAANDWILIVGVPKTEIYGIAHDWLYTMLTLACLAIGVSVGLAYAVTSHFTRVIHCLVKESLSIGKGDFTKRVHVPARDEFGLLARAFNEMADMLLFDKEHKAMVQGISNSIRQSLDLDDILNTTVRELGKHLEASRCCLALYDTRGTKTSADDELVFDYVWYNKKLNGAPLQNHSILITEHSVLKTILKHGGIISLDVLDESKGVPLFENADSSPPDWKSVKSLIACPISTKDGPLGMILVHQCDSLRVWTESELGLVEAIAGQVTMAMEHGRLFERTKRMAEQEVLINHIVKSVRSSLDLDTILNTVTRELLGALGVERVQIAQPRSENPLVITHEFTLEGLESCVNATMYPDNLDFTPQMSSARSQGTRRNTVLGINLDGLIDASAEDDQEIQIKPMTAVDQSTTMREAPIAVIHNVDKDSRCLPFQAFIHKVGSKSLIAAPLLHESRLVGLLIVHQCSSDREWQHMDVQLVTAIADQLAIAITHAHLFAQVRHQAITDGLTNLYNHVYFKNRLKEELKLADRKGTSCSLVMIDLDKLKMINDNFGHPVGDQAIRKVAEILKTILRSGDTAARYGGEEFAVILPETSLLEAALIADRLCTQIRNAHVPGLGRITASLGAATYPKQAMSAEELVERADIALYKSKNSGRDQAQIYEPDESEALPNFDTPKQVEEFEPINTMEIVVDYMSGRPVQPGAKKKDDLNFASHGTFSLLPESTSNRKQSPPQDSDKSGREDLHR